MTKEPEVEVCNALTSKGTKCTRPVEFKGYCHTHYVKYCISEEDKKKSDRIRAKMHAEWRRLNGSY